MHSLPKLVIVVLIIGGFIGFIVYSYFNGRKNVEQGQGNKKDNKQTGK